MRFHHIKGIQCLQSKLFEIKFLYRKIYYFSTMNTFLFKKIIIYPEKKLADFAGCA